MGIHFFVHESEARFIQIGSNPHNDMLDTKPQNSSRRYLYFSPAMRTWKHVGPVILQVDQVLQTGGAV